MKTRNIYVSSALADNMFSASRGAGLICVVSQVSFPEFKHVMQEQADKVVPAFREKDYQLINYLADEKGISNLQTNPIRVTLVSGDVLYVINPGGVQIGDEYDYSKVTPTITKYEAWEVEDYKNSLQQQNNVEQ